MTKAQTLAQQLFDLAVEPIMDLPLTNDVIKAKGLELAQIMLDQIYNRNTNPSMNDFYCNVNGLLTSENIKY